MPPTPTPVFALPDELHAKRAAELIEADEQHLRSVAEALADDLHRVEARLTAARRLDAGGGQRALDRDQEVRRLAARAAHLRRAGLDVCLGRMVTTEGEVIHLGRIGLSDRDGRRLLVDWRAPAAEPFFAATSAHPRGLASRRRYRWWQGQIVDYWDESLGPDIGTPLALDADSAFLASLGASRTARMRDVLSTLAADQDAIIRAGSQGTLVVDGGPGTGKTVVALHRAAYLLHADPRLREGRGGILFVGPHQPYLNYVADILPGLGEEGVLTCTVLDLVPGGRDLPPEADPDVAALKARADLVEAVEPAVALYEEPPSQGLLVETPWAEVWLSTEDWAEAFAAPDPGTPHNEAREQVWEALLDRLVDKHAQLESGASPTGARRALAQCPALLDAIGGAWPVLDAEELVADLWTVPAYLRRCAPDLTAAERGLLRREQGDAWTRSDVPLIDAARRRLGDRHTARRARRAAAEEAAQRAEMDDVVSHLQASDIHGEGVMAMLHGEDLRAALVEHAPAARSDIGRLDGPFAHIVVDEAQELTDAEWQMLLARCPARSLTVVGDRAQARRGFSESWAERLARVGVQRIRHALLTVNYRTPREVMERAAAQIREVLPDANIPRSVRSSGIEVRQGAVHELDTLLAAWSAHHAEGTVCVIGAAEQPGDPRVQWLTPGLAKGLEFDLVVLVDPEQFGSGIEGGVDRYVAMTRATRELVVLSAPAIEP
ncbi:RNA polymerase recycling motor ATPase HelR [Nocardioides daejeonensis]|uniref:RNA polymerase recycling motor ATPase HelR n=1 Tax=Nocardioides daejeonensis TaxID=1046556 RepID=UPI000D74BE2E|nr:RNA polymerase recycling motor ATPase HelR [Nocardioides daejeonensis]